METTRSSEGGISVDLEFLCGCLEVQTHSVALLFSVLGVTQQFVGASFFSPPDTSGPIIPYLANRKTKIPVLLVSLFCKAIHLQHVLLQHAHDVKQKRKGVPLCLPISWKIGWNRSESENHLCHCLLHNTHTHAYSCPICCYATRLLMDFCFDWVYAQYETKGGKKIMGPKRLGCRDGQE